ncbi:MAG: hypothetical protein KatS3mg060_2225 [Dehalococcoidia bacterium]|nr:MAG: hypothetical protein KatS3mg060_2225 [Dehalococcoidia bacterium]
MSAKDAAPDDGAGGGLGAAGGCDAKARGGRSPESRGPSAIVAPLGAQQRALVDRVAGANAPGNVEGLFAYHVLHDEPDFPLAWDVNPATPAWLAANADRLGHMPTLAALGYGLRHFRATAPPPVVTRLADGLAKLRLRDPFPEDRVSFAFDPLLFLGIALATVALGKGGDETRAWLVSVLDDPRCRAATPYHALLYGYIRWTLTGDADTIDDVRQYRDVAERALLEWGSRRGALLLVDPRVDLSRLQARVLDAAAVADPSALGAARAALVWSAVHASLVRSADELVLSRSHVAAVLRRFEAAMRRWRWDDPAAVKHPIRWEITAEREVQDILWLILRSVFDDVVDEETLPKVGHSTYRADFGIPSLRLLIEAKYARKAGDFKAVEKEIMEDSVAYLLETRDRYDRILVFIYDESASVQEHGLTEMGLRKLPQIEDVVVVSRPSQLPAQPGDGEGTPGRRSRGRTKKAPTDPDAAAAPSPTRRPMAAAE